jgi:hypothetical protein
VKESKPVLARRDVSAGAAGRGKGKKRVKAAEWYPSRTINP